MDGVEPQDRDAEPAEVVQPTGQPAEVADAVAVGVLEQPDVEAVDHPAAVPPRRHSPVIPSRGARTARTTGPLAPRPQTLHSAGRRGRAPWEALDCACGCRLRNRSGGRPTPSCRWPRRPPRTMSTRPPIATSGPTTAQSGHPVHRAAAADPAQALCPPDGTGDDEDPAEDEGEGAAHGARLRAGRGAVRGGPASCRCSRRAAPPGTRRPRSGCRRRRCSRDVSSPDARQASALLSPGPGPGRPGVAALAASTFAARSRSMRRCGSRSSPSCAGPKDMHAGVPEPPHEPVAEGAGPRCRWCSPWCHCSRSSLGVSHLVRLIISGTSHYTATMPRASIRFADGAAAPEPATGPARRWTARSASPWPSPRATVVALYRPLLEPMGLTHPQYLVMLALWEARAAAGQRARPSGSASSPATLSPAAQAAGGRRPGDRASATPTTSGPLAVTADSRRAAPLRGAGRAHPPGHRGAARAWSVAELEELRDRLTSVIEAARREG